MLEEIEYLKDELGRYYELAANWKPYEGKADKYQDMMTEDDHLIGKFNKYPQIANSAREAIHRCKIGAFAERQCLPDLIENKKELTVKYKEFIKECDEQLEKTA